MVQNQDVDQGANVPTYDPYLGYGWVTNQLYGLANNDDFDSYDLYTRPNEVGLRATRAHPTYKINVVTLIHPNGRPLPLTELGETFISFTRFKDGLVI